MEGMEEEEGSVVDYKRGRMQLYILFLRQRNILHQNNYCFYRLHILDCHCNIPHDRITSGIQFCYRLLHYQRNHILCTTNRAGNLNFLILEVYSRGNCDKSDSLKAFESVVAETVVEDLAVDLAVGLVEEDSVVEGMAVDLAVGLVEEDSVVEGMAVDLAVGLVADLAVGLVEEDLVVEEEDSVVDLAEDSVVDSVAMEVDSADSVVDSAGAYIDISIVRVSLSIPLPSSSILSIFSPRQFPRFDLQLLSLRLISFSPINCSRSRLHTRLFLHSCETYSHRYAFLDRLSIRE